MKGSVPGRAVAWLRARDQGLGALRRATRAAIVMPGLFALGVKVIGNPQIATFAAFGSFAQLLLVNFGGSMRNRAMSQVALSLTGAVLICLATAVSQHAVLATLLMAIVGFAVLFSGVMSSVLAGAANGLLLGFILPASLPGPTSLIPDRVAGWLLAGAAATLANTVLWPAPDVDPLRLRAVAALRALHERLVVGVAYVTGTPGVSLEDRDAAAGTAREVVATLLNSFYATPFRPSALSTSARAIVRLVDEIGWLATVLDQSPPDRGSYAGLRDVCAVKTAAARVLAVTAGLLDGSEESIDALDEQVTAMHAALAAMETSATRSLPIEPPTSGAQQAVRVVTSLEPTFRAQELSFAISGIAENVATAVAADRRSWWQHATGRQPARGSGAIATASQRAASHLDRHSVWLHNSIRGGIGLALAVFIADKTGVQHEFWVVLGALSVLRSNALSTGQNIVNGMLGTAVGLILGSLLVLAIGTNTDVLWALLPVAVGFSGFAPSAISFAAGQAGFSVTLLILYNLIAPVGWQIGLVRIEDIAIGSGVSLLVGFLFWPRGAAAVLREALAEAYSDGAAYLGSAIEGGTGDTTPTATDRERARAAAAARRLDDAFRQWLNERGARALSLADATRLVTGVAALRLASDAVLELWSRDGAGAPGSDSASRTQLRTSGALVTDWYADLAVALRSGQTVPDPLPVDCVADGRLVDAVSSDLRDDDGHPTATAVRMIWTADHVDGIRRLSESLAAPAAIAAEHQAQRQRRLGWIPHPARQAVG